MKIGLLDTFEGLNQIDKAVFCRHGKYAEGTRDPKTLAPGGEDSVPIIYQNQVGMEFDGESDRVFLARVELLMGWIGSNNELNCCTAVGAFLCFISSRTTAGRITLSNSAGRMSICPMRIR
jgi:hypothetical protein